MAKILGSQEPPYNGKVFVITHGRRRWVTDGELFKAYDWRWPGDVNWVAAAELNKYSLGANIPFPWTDKDFEKPPKGTTPRQMREILASQLRGKGIEFGAAANPFPVPLDCEVKYADLLPTEKLGQQLYHKEHPDFVDIDVIASFDDMHSIKDNSQDFIIACHVIEHTQSPFRALDHSWQKLKPGGKLLLIIPHHDHTFDRERKLTELSHLVLDFEDPSQERDLEHYYDFFRNSTGSRHRVTEAKLEEVVADHRANKVGYIHFHTWNEQSFGEMISYFSKHIHPWSKTQICPRIEHEEGYEFYCLLEK